ncbi:MAG: hypothetical protein FWE12_07500 [Oscillospiraceae bacterium]|nr:hypothetical protein [Oscillospiraceae bacterium]
MQDFEVSFHDFIGCEEIGQAQGTVHLILRMAFKAGWLAAGGEPPKVELEAPLFRTMNVNPDHGLLD